MKNASSSFHSSLISLVLFSTSALESVKMPIFHPEDGVFENTEDFGAPPF